MTKSVVVSNPLLMSVSAGTGSKGYRCEIPKPLLMRSCPWWNLVADSIKIPKTQWCRFVQSYITNNDEMQDFCWVIRVVKVFLRVFWIVPRLKYKSFYKSRHHYRFVKSWKDLPKIQIIRIQGFSFYLCNVLFLNESLMIRIYLYYRSHGVLLLKMVKP